MQRNQQRILAAMDVWWWVWLLFAVDFWLPMLVRRLIQKAHQSVDQVMGLWDSSQRSIIQPKASDRLTRCMHCGGTLLHHKSDGRAQSDDPDYGRRGECDVGPGHTETDEACGTREDNRPATVAV